MSITQARFRFVRVLLDSEGVVRLDGTSDIYTLLIASVRYLCRARLGTVGRGTGHFMALLAPGLGFFSFGAATIKV